MRLATPTDLSPLLLRVWLVGDIGAVSSLEPGKWKLGVDAAGSRNQVHMISTCFIACCISQRPAADINYLSMSHVLLLLVALL